MNKKETNQRRQDFLLTFFDNNQYDEKEVNNYWLIKQWNGGTKKWQVAIYSQEAFKNYKGYTKSLLNGKS